MITKQVVLILGAGASIPYGFPSGADLTKQILNEILNRGTDFANDIEACGFTWDEIHRFRQEFYYSSKLSIDAFLEHRREFVEIGKTCIARALIPCEKDNLSRGIDRHWYQYLLPKLEAPPQYFDQNRLSIITYNYDRSLEQYLFLALKSSYGLSDTEAATLVKCVPIYHLHGDLGKLPVLDRSGRAYEPTISPDILKQCAADIKIISENIAEHGEFRIPQEIIRHAEVICFLGFGFHTLNMQRLFNFTEFVGADNIYATTYGMPPSDQARVQKWFMENVRRPIELGDYDVLGALHHWSLLD